MASLNPAGMDPNTTTPTLLRSILNTLRDWFTNGIDFGSPGKFTVLEVTGASIAPTQAPLDNSTKLATTAYVDAATSAATSGVVTRLSTNITPVTRAATATGVLITSTLAAGKLATNGQAIRVRCAGTTSGTGSVASIQFRFGTTPTAVATIVLSGVLISENWAFDVLIARKSATEVYIACTDGQGSSNGVGASTVDIFGLDQAAGINLANTQIIDCNVSVADVAQSVTQLFQLVEFLP